MLVTVRLPVGNQIITGVHVERYDHGITVEDRLGVLHYVDNSRVVDSDSDDSNVLNKIVELPLEPVVVRQKTVSKSAVNTAAVTEKSAVSASSDKRSEKKRWMRSTVGELKRVPVDQVDNHLKNGYVFSGPRSKA